jgi:hypothetical protein
MAAGQTSKPVKSLWEDVPASGEGNWEDVPAQTAQQQSSQPELSMSASPKTLGQFHQEDIAKEESESGIGGYLRSIKNVITKRPLLQRLSTPLPLQLLDAPELIDKIAAPASNLLRRYFDPTNASGGSVTNFGENRPMVNNPMGAMASDTILGMVAGAKPGNFGLVTDAETAANAAREALVNKPPTPPEPGLIQRVKNYRNDLQTARETLATGKEKGLDITAAARRNTAANKANLLNEQAAAQQGFNQQAKENIRPLRIQVKDLHNTKTDLSADLAAQKTSTREGLQSNLSKLNQDIAAAKQAATEKADAGVREFTGQFGVKAAPIAEPAPAPRKYSFAEPEVEPMVDSAVETRLNEIKEVFQSGIGELSGKGKSINTADMNAEAVGNLKQSDTGFGKIPLKTAFEELGGIKEPPGRIATAIEKDKNNPLYLRVKNAVADRIPDRFGDEIENANMMALERRPFPAEPTPVKMTPQEIAQGTQKQRIEGYRLETQKGQALRNKAKEIFNNDVRSIQTGTKQVEDPYTSWEGEGAKTEPVVKNVPGPVDVSEAQKELRPFYDKYQDLIRTAKQNGSPGAQAVIDIVEGDSVVPGSTALDNMAALNKLGYGKADIQIRTPSEAIARMAGDKYRAAIYKSLDNIKDGNIAKEALENEKLIYQKRDKLYNTGSILEGKPFARQAAVKFEASGGHIESLINDPIKFHAFWDRVEGTPFENPLRQQIADNVLGSGYQDFTKNWQKLMPEIKSRILTPDMIANGDRLAAEGPAALQKISEGAKAKNAEIVQGAMKQLTDIGKKKQQIGGITKNARELNAKIGDEKQAIQFGKQAKSLELKQKSAGMKSVVDEQTYGQRKALAGQVREAREKVQANKSLKNKAMIGAVVVGASGVGWKARNIASMLGW